MYNNCNNNNTDNGVLQHTTYPLICSIECWSRHCMPRRRQTHPHNMDPRSAPLFHHSHMFKCKYLWEYIHHYNLSFQVSGNFCKELEIYKSGVIILSSDRNFPETSNDCMWLSFPTSSAGKLIHDHQPHASSISIKLLYKLSYNFYKQKKVSDLM